MLLDMLEKCQLVPVRIPQLVPTECLESSQQDRNRGNLQGVWERD